MAYFEINPDWLGIYTKCLIRNYQAEHRFGLLWRRYDPGRERQLHKDTAKKLSFLNIFKSIKEIEVSSGGRRIIVQDYLDRIKGPNFTEVDENEYMNKTMDKLQKTFDEFIKLEYGPDVDLTYKMLYAWGLEEHKKIIIEYEKKRHHLRNRIFGQIKQTAKRNKGSGWVFLDFNNTAH